MSLEITNPCRKRKFPFEEILAGSSKIKVSETGIKMSHKLAQVFDRHMSFNYAGEAKLIGNLLLIFFVAIYVLVQSVLFLGCRTSPYNGRECLFGIQVRKGQFHLRTKFCQFFEKKNDVDIPLFEAYSDFLAHRVNRFQFLINPAKFIENSTKTSGRHNYCTMGKLKHFFAADANLVLKLPFKVMLNFCFLWLRKKRKKKS